MKRERLLEILHEQDETVTSVYTDADLLEYIDCLTTQENEMVDEERWWQIWEKVVKIGNVFLKFSYAVSSSDNAPAELGYEDNGLDDVWEAKQVPVTKMTYVRK